MTLAVHLPQTFQDNNVLGVVTSCAPAEIFPEEPDLQSQV